MDMHIVTKLLQLRRLFQYIIYTCAHLRRWFVIIERSFAQVSFYA